MRRVARQGGGWRVGAGGQQARKRGGIEYEIIIIIGVLRSDVDVSGGKERRLYICGPYMVNMLPKTSIYEYIFAI